jgi:phage terminase large subunit
LRYRYYNPPDRDTANYEIRFVYDDNGKVQSESAFDEKGMRLHHIRYLYNKKEYCSKAIAYKADDEITGEEEYDYEWDEHGNWMQRVTSIRGKPWIITERKITYY